MTLVADLLRVLRVLPRVEWNRRRLSLHHAVARARVKSARRGTRSVEDRARLQRVIGAVDACLPGGKNCVRRALIEMSLDDTAARERLLAGLKTGGRPRSGHAWLESHSVRETYDAVIAV
jgi:hypothetical protein